MARVFLLGSGFSVAAGAPLAKEVLAKIFSIEKIAPEIVALKSWLEKHLFMQQPNWLEVSNFEEVLSRLELFEHYSGTRLKNKYLLESKTNLLLREFIAQLQPNKLQANLSYYDSFVKHLKADDVVITFNYDLVVENALNRHNIGVNYQLALPSSAYSSNLIDADQKRLTVIKLHGSINLGFCPDCLTIQEASAESILCECCSSHSSMIQQQPVSKSSLRPFLIPPTLFKSYSLLEQRRLWYTAYQFLAQADEVIIIGYSLPSADILATQLLDFAYRARIKAHQIMVINGKQANTEQYKLIYPQGLVNTRLSFLDWLELQATQP